MKQNKMIQYLTYQYPELGAEAKVASAGGPDKADEWHVMLRLEPRAELFQAQMQRIAQAEAQLLQGAEWRGATVVARRYFVSDSTNQQPWIPQHRTQAVAAIQQPPLDATRVAVWLYLMRDVELSRTSQGLTVARRGAYTHLWAMGQTWAKGDSAAQTTHLLSQLQSQLAPQGATVEGHCVRTWFYVRDVDSNYAGLVRARREWFEAHGLTPHTHYIASTGIGGAPATTAALVQMDAYALTGHNACQVRHLHAPEWLNPTHEYGVTFERGTLVEYADRAHVFISGTASIDHRGEVLHQGDVVGQTHRMWQNVEALLRDAHAGMEDVAHIIVYLRDMADYAQVEALFAKRFPGVPTVFTLAPVCRPTWLIEMECMAIAPRRNPQLKPF